MESIPCDIISPISRRPQPVHTSIEIYLYLDEYIYCDFISNDGVFKEEEKQKYKIKFLKLY